MRRCPAFSMHCRLQGLLTLVAILNLASSECLRADDPDAPAPAPDLIPRLFEASGEQLSLAHPRAPADLAELRSLRARLRERHARALGVPLEHRPAPVEFRVVEIHKRRGYELREILFESREGVVVPAHLYLPAPPADEVPSDATRKPGPAVLCVHGHWSEGKRATAVHARSVFLAMRGFTVLALDAIGAGERAFDGITYHGRQLGYQALPTGLTLAGLQVLDNRRALDLLASLPGVDPDRIGVTGASGGGNQTFHIAILDDRVRAAVAVCFYGAYAGYLRGAHCACETIPGVLQYAEEGALAGTVAPRALLVIAAKEDGGAAFRVEDARRNAATAARFYSAAGAADAFRLLEFEGGHDYSRSMREAMVAFFERALGDGVAKERVPEPELDLLAPDRLHVLEAPLPDPRSFVPRIVSDLAAERVAAFARRGPGWGDPRQRETLRLELEHEILGGFPRDARLVTTPGQRARTSESMDLDIVRIETEPGVSLALRVRASESVSQEKSESEDAPSAMQRVLLVLGEITDPVRDALADEELARGTILAQLSPRGTGPTAWPAANAVGCPDYLLAQGSVVLGRPMLGQWVWDVLRAVEYLVQKHPDARIALHGEGVNGLVAMLAAVLDDRIAAVGTSDQLASWRFDGRFDDRWGLAHFVPGILAVGDIAQITAGLGERTLVLGSPRRGDGERLDPAEIDAFLALARGSRPDSLRGLHVEREAGPREVLRRVLR